MERRGARGEGGGDFFLVIFRQLNGVVLFLKYTQKTSRIPLKKHKKTLPLAGQGWNLSPFREGYLSKD
jgi:hypothetical protein